MSPRMTFPIALAVIVGAAAAPGLSATQVINGVTCGRSPCPRPLELVDGESVMITLSGERLGGLISGLITDDAGRPVEGVTVELAPFRLATRRGATVTARGAPALSGLQLRFRTRLRRTVTAPLELATAAAVTTAPASLEPQDPNAPISDPNRTLTTVEGSLPSLSSASPSTVDLAPGSSATVVLQGANLNALERASVVRNGSTVDNVTARLGPSSDPTRREVRLSAAAASSPPWNEPLELVVSTSLTALPRTSLTAPVQVQVVAPAARITTRALRMTGLRFPIRVATPRLRMTGLRFPIRIATQQLQMTGIREENP